MKITIPNGPQERGKKPSVSSLARYAACPGSWRLEKDLPEPPESEDAARGNRIHAWLSGQDCELSEEEKDIADRIQSQYQAFIEKHPSDSIFSETRLWYSGSWSGMVDRVVFDATVVAAVFDWKTGRVGAPDAETNLQLRGYAVLVKENFPHLKEIRVSIIQPLAGKPTMVTYLEEDLETATLEVNAIFGRAICFADLIMFPTLESLPKTALNPTPEGCKYCKASKVINGKIACPAISEQTLEIEQISERAVVSELSNSDLALFYTKFDVVKGFIKEVEGEIKKRLGEGREVGKCLMKPGRTDRTVTNAQAVFGRFGDTFNEEEFTAFLKLSLPDMEKGYAKKKGLKEKEAKAEIKALLGGLIEYKTCAPSLDSK